MLILEEEETRTALKFYEDLQYQGRQGLKAWSEETYESGAGVKNPESESQSGFRELRSESQDL